MIEERVDHPGSAIKMWLATTGFFEHWATSRLVRSLECATSGMMPTRFISATTVRPRRVHPGAVRVHVSAVPVKVSGSREPAHGMLRYARPKIIPLRVEYHCPAEDVITFHFLKTKKHEKTWHGLIARNLFGDLSGYIAYGFNSTISSCSTSMRSRLACMIALRPTLPSGMVTVICRSWDFPVRSSFCPVAATLTCCHFP